MTQKLEERAKADDTLNEIVIGKAITEKRKKKVKWQENLLKTTVLELLPKKNSK